MGLIKKIDVEKHFAAKRAMRRTGALLVSRPDTTGSSQNKTAGTKANAQDFVKDFSLGHSSSGAPVTPSK